MNNVFANFVFGVILDETDPKFELLPSYLELVEWEESAYESDPAKSAMFAELSEGSKALLADIRKEFGLTTDVAQFFIVDDDVFLGSERGAGDLLFGIGVTAFPLEDPLQNQDAYKLKASGGDWHSWVT